MKKILFAAIAVVAMSFVSCGNKVETTEGIDSTNVDSVVTDTVDSIVVDSISVDSVVAE